MAVNYLSIINTIINSANVTDETILLYILSRVSNFFYFHNTI